MKIFTLFKESLSKINELHYKIIFFILFSGYLVVVVRTAWMCDDAYITLRTVDNFVNGFGLTWNVGERVQVYTHPLWMFFLSFFYAFTREPYYTTIILSIVLCAASILILLFISNRKASLAIIPMSILIASRSFIDYSTSGLEQPMTFFFLSLFVYLMYFAKPNKHYLFFLGLTASAATLNRSDTLLLFIPCLAVAFWERRNLRSIIVIALGFLPILLWEFFSLFYYGFFVPNTAFAKLGHGLPKSLIIEQGFAYFAESFRNDPITLISISVSILSVALPHCRRYRPLAAGIVLYLAYIVYIGGDFMAGRYFAAPLFAACFIVSKIFSPTSLAAVIAGFLIIVTLGLMSPYPTIASGSQYGSHRKTWGDLVDRNGIADERAFWFHCAGLFSETREPGPVDCSRMNIVLDHKKKNEKFIESGGVGFLGYFAGPSIYVFDGLGITDPLIARIPMSHTGGWRPGHFPKVYPKGYIETLKTGKNQIEDKSIKKYYKSLHSIISNKLSSSSRIREIWNMNRGKYDSLIKKSDLKPPLDEPLPLSDFSNPRFKEGGQCSTQYMMYYRKPMWFKTDGVSHKGGVEVCANDDAEYRLEILRDNEVVDIEQIPAASEKVGVITRHCHPLKESVYKNGYNRIRWTPLVGNYACFSYIRLVDSCEQ